jgi:hypothetical protein
MGIELPPGITEADYRAMIVDNTRFIPRLGFTDNHGKIQTMSRPFGEQLRILRALNRSRNVLVVKPRNIGCGTIVQARDFHHGWAAIDPVATIVMAHEGDATKRHLARYRDYHGSLPSQLRHPISVDNLNTYQFADTKAVFQCATAGGKGGGKGFTFQRAHFTELAYYDVNPRDVFMSVTATLHEGPHYAVTVESTSNGPDDFFHELAQNARKDANWEFLFFGWQEHTQFAMTPASDWRRTDEEERLALQLGVSDAQLAWRRDKIIRGGLDAFHKYYPSTVEEAFLSGGESYFPGTLLEIAGALEERKDPRRIYEKYNPRKRYSIGVDAGHGVGKDYSVIQVVDHLGRQVAVWADNTTRADSVADIACELGMMYGGALLCIEAMGPGLVTLARAQQLDYPNLYGDKGKAGFHTSRQSKELVFGHARQVIGEGNFLLVDRMTVNELINIRESETGKIEGAKGKHDDHAMAWVLAIWAVRRLPTGTQGAHEVLSERMGLGQQRLRATLPF